MLDSSGQESVIENLIVKLAGLPSIGRKTAQRLAYHLLSQESRSVLELAQALTEAKARVHGCPCCGNFTELDLCRICASDRRQKHLICVVEKPADILAFERSGTFTGVYHVLGGSISPLDGIGPDQLNFSGLWARTLGDRSGQARMGDEQALDNRVELILALNTNAEGEATATYIAQKLRGTPVKISRIARGIPMGSELEYIDELTVQRALEGRVQII